MAWRVNQIQSVLLAVRCFVIEPDGLRLNCDPTLTLNVHVIKQLLLCLTVCNRMRSLHQAVCQGRLAMVNVGNDREVSDETWISRFVFHLGLGTFKNVWTVIS